MTKLEELNARADELRGLGYKVRVDHIRRWRAAPGLHMTTLHEAKTVGIQDWSPPWVLDQKGGTTVCTISKEDGTLIATGTSRTSDLDNYSKSVGRMKALGRALGEFERREPLSFGRIIDALGGAS